jgi:hypothetical protein
MVVEAIKDLYHICCLGYSLVFKVERSSRQAKNSILRIQLRTLPKITEGLYGPMIRVLPLVLCGSPFLASSWGN